METIESQNKKIRNHLQQGKSITPLEALYLYGCFRLSARIYDLRDQGMHITVKTIAVTSPSVFSGKKHVTQYTLKNETQNN